MTSHETNTTSTSPPPTISEVSDNNAPPHSKTIFDSLVLPVFILSLVLIVSFVLVVFTTVVIKLYTFKFAKIRCHICRSLVRPEDWSKGGGHRENCSRRNRAFLNRLPSPFDVRCPTCLAYLKLLPKDRGKTFTCDDPECPFKKGKIHNNGFNRLNCFGCDYDLCDSCAHRRLFVLTKFKENHGQTDVSDNCSVCLPEPRQTSTTTTTTTSSSRQLDLEYNGNNNHNAIYDFSDLDRLFLLQDPLMGPPQPSREAPVRGQGRGGGYDDIQAIYEYAGVHPTRRLGTVNQAFVGGGCELAPLYGIVGAPSSAQYFTSSSAMAAIAAGQSQQTVGVALPTPVYQGNADCYLQHPDFSYATYV